MARKATYQELEETAEVVVDRTAAVFGPALTARRRPLDDAEAAKPAAAILPIYLREMGSTPLINEHQGSRTGSSELQEARTGMAKLAKISDEAVGRPATRVLPGGQAATARSVVANGRWTTSRSSTRAC